MRLIVPALVAASLGFVSSAAFAAAPASAGLTSCKGCVSNIAADRDRPIVVAQEEKQLKKPKKKVTNDR